MLAIFYVRALTQSALYTVYKHVQLVTKALLDFYKIFSIGSTHGKSLVSTQPIQVATCSERLRCGPPRKPHFSFALFFRGTPRAFTRARNCMRRKLNAAKNCMDTAAASLQKGQVLLAL